MRSLHGNILRFIILLYSKSMSLNRAENAIHSYQVSNKISCGNADKCLNGGDLHKPLQETKASIYTQLN